jgi:hypothetical protein
MLKNYQYLYIAGPGIIGLGLFSPPRLFKWAYPSPLGLRGVLAIGINTGLNAGWKL